MIKSEHVDCRYCDCEGMVAGSTCSECHGTGKKLVYLREDESPRLLKLLRRAHMALLCYTQSHGTPHTELMTEMADALGVDADGNTKELGDDS